MALSNKTKGVLIRGAKGLAAVGVAFLAKYVASPDVLNLVGASNAWVVTVVAVPGLLALEKWLNVAPTGKYDTK